ncbi:Uu.00g071990.m01.CDS01 [Anthostomella pinea]|uniref:Uu.00g071990.m01.CDS01 n=1 Tax=Anthostomella pinea TaxID=933095 RepID=A0AAI8VV04_9PEZI|nr:Uu.00g071990.m01.CDS01 [Anthostomella pinea]
MSAAIPAPKAKATASASKRKAVEETSPVATKKTKATKEEAQSKTSQTSRSSATKKKAPGDADTDDEKDQPSDDEGDDAQALAQVIDGEAEEEDGVVGADTYQEGQDVGKIPEVSKELVKSSKSEGNEPGVVYVGRIPRTTNPRCIYQFGLVELELTRVPIDGFEEHGMRSYFSQFGAINKLRMSRNKATGRSRHFAFIEFAEAGVADIVAKTMDNYLLYGHVLKVKVVPKSQVHQDLWKGSTNKRFKKIPWNKMAGNRLAKPLSESGWTERISKEEQRRNDRAKKLSAIGYEFDAPKMKAVEDVPRNAVTLEAAHDEAPAAIEAAADDDAEAKPEPVEVEEETKSVDEELAVKKRAKVKSTKKTKKSSKTKTSA